MWLDLCGNDGSHIFPVTHHYHYKIMITSKNIVNRYSFLVKRLTPNDTKAATMPIYPIAINWLS